MSGCGSLACEIASAPVRCARGLLLVQLTTVLLTQVKVKVKVTLFTQVVFLGKYQQRTPRSTQAPELDPCPHSQALCYPHARSCVDVPPQLAQLV
jgi:hypothetical protein